MKLHHPVPQPTGRSRRLALLGIGSLCVALVGTAGQVPVASANDGAHHHRNAFRQVNLISDIRGMAKLTDPAVRNPWGIAFGPTTPLWVANQFSESPTAPVTVYSGANGQSRIQKVILPTGEPLEVAASSPTGIVFNDTDAFKIRQDGVRTPARFIFTENFLSSTTPGLASQVTGWSNVPAPAATTTPGSMLKDPAFYTGLAILPATRRHGPWLLASDFGSGMVDIYNRRYEQRERPRLFVDNRALDHGLLAYNVMTLTDGRVYVAYGNFGVPGSITVFNKNGKLLKRLVVRDERLLGPWGMAIAPHSWGRLAGSLLVGNVENGLIVAYNRHNGHNRGALRNEHGRRIVIPGLWGIQFGNGIIGTPRRLIFAAGIGDEQGEGFYEHGLVGYVRPAPRHMDHD
jgi:uncharacterized protein (TIGR03118 family)